MIVPIPDDYELDLSVGDFSDLIGFDIEENSKRSKQHIWLHSNYYERGIVGLHSSRSDFKRS